MPYPLPIRSKYFHMDGDRICSVIFNAVMLAGLTLGWIPVLALGLKNNNVAMIIGGSAWCAIFGLGCLAFGKHSLFPLSEGRLVLFFSMPADLTHFLIFPMLCCSHHILFCSHPSARRISGSYAIANQHLRAFPVPVRPHSEGLASHARMTYLLAPQCRDTTNVTISVHS